MNKPKDLPIAKVDPDDIGHNDSNNTDFSAVLNARVSRRNLLRGGMATAAGAVFGSLGLSACGGNGNGPIGNVTTSTTTTTTLPQEKLLGFNAVAKSLADNVVVPVGYAASVLYALGDPLNGTTAAYKNDGTDTDFENRAGDHHDGMEWFGLSGAGAPSATAVDRGLLGINHEATTDESKASFFLHANGGTTTLPRPAAEVDKEIPIHGVAIVEVKKAGASWSYVKDSGFNRRITPMTEIEIAGPARGNALMATKFSNDGTKTRGTLNNCGTGKTPWGTLLTGEENWGGYFARDAGDVATRGGDAAKSNVALRRYGIDPRAQSGKTAADAYASRHGWESVVSAEDKYVRWNVTQSGGAATGDYRNEMNGMGYIVEIDPYDKTKAIKKRTALGRFAHESAAFGRLVAGQPLAVYQGDDSRGEYIYKFVSTQNWNTADANPTDRIATGDKYLDSGKLYAAKFNADGSGEWIELSLANIPGSYTTYTFADQADILVNARLAADAVGATKMDRPEWCATNPANGEVYFTLTNNSNRRVEPSSSSQMVPDAANPRVYTDMKGSSTQQGNVNGHLIRLREGASGAAATGFTWDVYLFGAEAGADKTKVNLSSLTDEQDFSSPDGLAFTPSTGICWIQTDDGAYTDVTNCMMLAALPGEVGDGASRALSHTKADTSTLNVTTYIGKAPTTDTLKRFLVGPVGSEITGICETPDGKALFVNIQHPGETTKHADITNPAKYTSQWPSNASYGAGRRPRSATIVITKNDGGRIGT